MRPMREIDKDDRLIIAGHSMAGGIGCILLEDWKGTVIWGRDEGGLEHVSVSPFDHSFMPSWDDMCQVKDIFFEDEELVVQIHPPKNEHVNIQPNCLHLWRDKAGRLDELLSCKGGA